MRTDPGRSQGGQGIGTFDRVGSIGRCGCGAVIGVGEAGIAELVAQGLPSRLIGKEIGRAHSAVVDRTGGDLSGPDGLAAARAVDRRRGAVIR